jgi:hypothetical protein
MTTPEAQQTADAVIERCEALLGLIAREPASCEANGYLIESLLSGAGQLGVGHKIIIQRMRARLASARQQASARARGWKHG